MVVRGRVEGGVVVLADGVCLPEGQDVVVLAPDQAEPGTHSILDIPTLSLGELLHPFSAEDDLLGELLEGRG